MHYFKTVEEKALEWGVSPQHIQSLCRKEKIEGAVKRAGAWFIPDDVPNPIINTKSDAQHFQFVGTRKRIFDSAIKLFMLNGFERVTIKDIADDVGIAQSAIYNHFKTKKEILDVIYDYYCRGYLKNRLSIEDVEPILRKGSLLDMIKCVRYAFDEDDLQRMSDITKIVFQRSATDKRANEIFKALIMKEGIDYVEAVFDRAVEIGRLAPLDTHAISIFINSVSLYTLNRWITDPSPDNMEKTLEEEQTQYKYAAQLLTDLDLGKGANSPVL